jgi:Fe-S cluster biogenesis protein NfuA
MTTRSGAIVPDLSQLPPDAGDAERMQALVDILSAYIEYFHGGHVELVQFDGEVLQVRLSGNCERCPLSTVTLHGWIEGTVRPFFPNLKRVESV